MNGSTMTERAIAEYLNDRQKLIVLLMKLTSATEDRQQDVAETLRIRLCERVVDYLSNGYFRIYGDLLSSQSWLEPRAYAAFEATTTTVLGFNDGFAKPGPVAHTRFKTALADLALALETRFELEDRLFGRLQPDASASQRHRSIRRPLIHVAFATT